MDGEIPSRITHVANFVYVGGEFSFNLGSGQRDDYEVITVTTDPELALRLTFASFDIQASEGCTSDRLTIYDATGMRRVQAKIETPQYWKIPCTTACLLPVV